MVVGPLKLPQAPAPLLPQLTDQVTPALAESFLTGAVSAAVALVRSEAGAPESVTEIAGAVVVVVLLLPPPHARSAAITAKTINKRTDWRHFIECFKSAVIRTSPSFQSKAPGVVEGSPKKRRR